METAKDIMNLLEDNAVLRETIEENEEEIKKLGFQILKELMKLPDWELMFCNCYDHYKRYPDSFFKSCKVYGCGNHLYFEKCYSDGSDYIVLDINLTVPLEEQISQIKELEEKNKRDLEYKEKVKDFEIYKQLKEKYGFN